MTNRIYQKWLGLYDISSKSLQMSEYVSNPLYKLLIGNLQLVLNIVLIGSIFEH